MKVGHWYTAQIPHYGLQCTKDKNIAKVRLLNALNQGTLAVPAWIRELEADMKKDWESENKKIKKEMGKQKPKPTPSERSGSGVYAGHGANAKHELQGPHGPYGDNFTVNLSVSSSRSPTSGQYSPSQPSNQQQTPKGKRVRGYDDGFLLSPVTQIPQSRTPKRSRVKQDIDNTPPPRFKPDTTGYDQDSSDNYTFSGSYSITCPTATQNFPSVNPNSLQLTLYLDNHRSCWWASFSWGAWDFIVKMRPGPSFATLDQLCTLGWRFKDWDTGELKLGRGCTGQMTFYRNKTVYGSLSDIPGVGLLEFWGHRIGSDETGATGEEFQLDWERLPREAYGR
ncbi:hypothetical protein P154DRAFT_587287 [Amniculicola lignicola CBS 123094]|uniref:Uncharacterized protein n=1 Tax=Amniculicola lignicola CBS 123094 TaxID=1392246 RepID=A0A6A5WSI9_9PLEO|nr:hypothetical protein P154DRAFT_587287 [Amniculicola lignicola CBS 123094]